MSEKEPKILIASFIKNMAFCFPQWRDAILAIDYPKELIKFVIVENDSVDATWDMLENFKKDYEQDYMGINLVRVNTGEQGTLYWDRRTSTGQYNKFVEYIISIHNDIFTKYLDDTDYWICIQGDNIVPPHIIKSNLKIFNSYDNVGMVSALIRDRTSGGSFDRLTARRIVDQYPPKPWRLDSKRPIAWTGKGDSIKRSVYLYPPDQDPKLLHGAVKDAMCYTCLTIPTPIYRKLVMWYHVDDQVVSYLYQLENMGLDFYMNNDVKIQHIDRDGSYVLLE